MREYKFLEKILSNLIIERELSYLSLDKSNDDLSKLFRAFIIQFFKKSPDHKKSLDILRSERFLFIMFFKFSVIIN